MASIELGYGLLTCQHHPDDPRSDASIYAEAVDLVVAAERLGLHSAWTSEHHYVDDGYMSAQLPVLAAMAARTERILLGTGVLLAPLFEPLRLAEDAATVDLLAGGRLVLGLGQGWREEEFEALGLAVGDRLRRFVGTVAVLREAWGDGLVAGDGRTFTYPRVSVTPKPARPGGIPIWYGGHAEPAIRRAGRIADGFLGGEESPEDFAAQCRWAAEGLAEAGRDPGAFTPAVYVTTFAWRGADAWARIREAAWYASWKYDDMDGARSRPGRGGRPPALDPATEAEQRRWVLLGEPEAVAERIRAFGEAAAGTGLGTPVFVARSWFPGLAPAVNREALEILGAEVRPLLA